MKRLLATATALLAATPALAHHPLGGMPMESFAQGALSGVGHPILGFDHLFFVVAVGIAALFTGARLIAPAAYIAAMLIGCALMAAGIGLPLKEAMIALSLLVVGGLIATGRTVGVMPMLVLFAAFGLFHGSAFGDAIAGQEGGVGGAVMAGYLLGLGAVQYLIAIGAGFASARLGAISAAAPTARIAGAMVAGVGLFLTMEVLEGPALSALGLG